MDLNTMLKAMVEKRASDLHIKPGRPPMYRVDGSLLASDDPPLDPATATQLALELMDEKQKKDFETRHEMDLAYSIGGVGRFRANIFRQRGSIEVVLRLIPMNIPSLDQIHMPEVLKQVAMENRGLILITGMTGSGKTTTITAFLDHINQHRPLHIVTLEDPIEFTHRDKKASFTQREIGIDTEDFKSALRYVLRQDPDVILIGEMRDSETVGAALSAAETGHLVISTLHTIDAVKTIDRILDFFPSGQQDQVRVQLARTLKAVISQRLLQSASGVGRVPACEILIATPTIRALLEENKINQVRAHIAEGGTQYGMMTFDQSIVELCKGGLITRDEAMAEATSPSEVDLALKGISTSKASARSVLEFMEKEQNKQALDEQLSAARRMVAGRRWEEADKALSEVLSHNPEHEEANNLMQKVREQFGASDRSDKAKPLLQEGARLMRTGAVDKAILEWKKALQADPGNKLALQYIKSAEERAFLNKKMQEILGRGVTAMAEQKWAEAMNAFREVLRSDPQHEQAKDYMKQVTDKVRKLEAERLAVDFNRRAVEHYNKSELLEALRLWNQAVERKPDWDELKQYMGQVQAHVEQSGVPDLPVAHPSRPEVLALHKDGCLAFANGDFRKAEAAFEAAMNKAGIKKGTPGSSLESLRAKAEFWGQKAVSDLVQESSQEAIRGQLGAARKKVAEALKMYPGHPQAQAAMAPLLTRIRSEADRLYKEGMQFQESKQNDQALERFEAVLEMEPENEKAKRAAEDTRQRIERLKEIFAKID